MPQLNDFLNKKNNDKIIINKNYAYRNIINHLNLRCDIFYVELE